MKFFKALFAILILARCVAGHAQTYIDEVRIDQPTLGYSTIMYGCMDRWDATILPGAPTLFMWCSGQVRDTSAHDSPITKKSSLIWFSGIDEMGGYERFADLGPKCFLVNVEHVVRPFEYNVYEVNCDEVIFQGDFE